jgi:sulfur relay (sulfurtransferase) DsrC/TusE family protein
VKTIRTRTDSHDLTELINDKHGHPLSSKHKILHRWREYFEELFNMPPTINNTVKPSQTIDEMELEIIKAVVEIVIRKAPRNKAPGIHNIPAELLVAGAKQELHGYLEYLTLLGNSKQYQMIGNRPL